MVHARAEAREAVQADRGLAEQVLVRVLQPEDGGAIAQEETEDLEPLLLEVLALVDDETVEPPGVGYRLGRDHVRHTAPELGIRLHLVEVEPPAAVGEERIAQAVERAHAPGLSQEGL